MNGLRFAAALLEIKPPPRRLECLHELERKGVQERFEDYFQQHYNDGEHMLSIAGKNRRVVLTSEEYDRYQFGELRIQSRALARSQGLPSRTFTSRALVEAGLEQLAWWRKTWVNEAKKHIVQVPWEA